MTIGKATSQIVAECVRRGVAIPPPHNDPPRIGIEFALFFAAFEQMSWERDPPFKAGNKWVVPFITRKAIREWAGFYGYARDLEFQEELFAYVQALDRVWVDVEATNLNRKKSNA